MALANIQTVTIGATPQSLPRLLTGVSDSTYGNADGTVSLRVSHTTGRNGSRRSLVRIEQTKIAADPLTSVNSEVKMSAHLVIDAPKSGFNAVEKKDLIKALTDYLSAGTFAATIQILGGES